MQDLSVLFLGTHFFALEGLKILAKAKGFKVGGLVTIPDRPQKRGLKTLSSPVKVWGKKQGGLPIWTPENLSSSHFKRQMGQHCFDVAVVMDYGLLLPKDFLDLFPRKIVNIHPSLLPRWRGAAPVERALLAGDSKSGVCLQLVGEELDAGDIIKQYSFPLSEKDSALEVYEQALKYAKKLLEEDLLKYVKGELQPVPQKKQGLTYAKKIRKREALIDWKRPASDIHNQIRAFLLGPQAFTFLKNKRFKIYRSEVSSLEENSLSTGSFLPGEVLHSGKRGLFVACGEDVLKLLEVQKESRKRQKVKDFLKGSPIQKGDRFESTGA